ncbi:amino acid adenylation domain-containing protein [Longimicrobium sp.]|uniref:amino acid adenylation domain-containing protein n=1 Tax=Longimicrobium sp. TaxID=2029185 RepID=UPI003B3ADF7E
MIATSTLISSDARPASQPGGRFAMTAECGPAFAHCLFEAAAGRSPGAPAAVFAGRVLTYGELNAAANRLARVLRRRGVGADVRVAVAMERGPALPAALLAVLKAGGAYVPVDPEYPAERIRYVLGDSGARLVLCTAATRARVAECGAETLVADPESDLLLREDAHDLEGALHPDALAYVIYTSGSTGRPKGVGVSHRALGSHNLAIIERYGLTAADRASQLTSIGFDISVEEIFPTWAAGGAVVFRPERVAGFGTEFMAWLADERVTVLNIPTAFWHAWVHDLAASGAALPSALRLAIVGGEKAQPAALAEWRRIAGGGIRWMNGYGPTEAAVTATIYEAVDRVDGEVPIGRAMSNARTYILSDELLAISQGELCIGGEGVARGYLGRPGLTAERFAPDPFGAPGSRLYRTGDRARWRADGEIEFLGRVDEQVKIAGFRVEPGEVEAVLAEHPAVAQAAVVAREFDGAGVRLVAYAVPALEGIDEAELRRWLRDRLPGFLVPSALVVIGALPLSAHGKIDRRALPAPAELDPPLPGFAEPRGDTEREVARAWREVLGIPRVGADADFWALGGHSLLAMQVLSRIRQRLGVELPVRALFDAPTVAALAAAVDAARGAAVHLPHAPLRASRRSDPQPLSFAQQRLWFLHQMEPDSAFYNLPFAVRMEGALEVDALRHALAEIVRRQEVLRTTFRADASGSWQVIHPAPPSFDLPIADLRALPREWARGEVPRLMRDAAEQPFDLRRGLMLRALLIHVADTEHALVLNLHHVAGDGWSIDLLFRELSALYGAFRAGEPSPLPEPPLQYADYAEWQRAWMAGGALDEQLAYWRERLAGAPAVLELPTDRPRPAVQSHRGASHAFEVPPALAARLRALARETDSTLFMVLLAAFDLLIHRLSGRDDVVVGSPIAGRMRGEVEGLIGFFVNTMALRTDLSGDPTFRALIGRVRETTLEAYAHQDLPFERVVEAIQPDRTLSHNPLFQVAFALQNVPVEPVRLPGLALRLEEVDSGTSKFDLFLEMEEQGERLRGRVEYATDLWEAATAERMIRLFLHLLEGVAADPDRPASRAELVDAEERRRLVKRWSGAARVHPHESTVHATFAAVAESDPSRVALSWDGGTMTYGELHERSSRLANHLRALGVGADQPVALVMDRSPELVVAILGVLKAGGAYVPINPQYPRGRVELMLADCGARVVLAQVRLATSVPPDPEVRTVFVDVQRDAFATASSDDPRVDTGPDGAAYVIYTSGSTGRPKGVVVPHRAVLRLVRGGDSARFAADETWLQLAPVAFDASTLELWAPLLNGGRVAIFPAELPTPEALGGFISRHGVTGAWLTAGLFHQMVDANLPALGGLRQLLAGGDVLSVPHVRRVLEAHPSLRLVNGYGPTENTTFSCCHRLRAEDAGRASIPIGQPIAGSTAYVLDAQLHPVPVDVPGELFVGGEGLARGYLNGAAATASRYIPHPFSATPGARLYATGDRVRWRPDGTLEFLGRIDQQVKIRGYRIEPGEVEAALQRDPAVADCVVLVREDVPGERRLVAYVVPVATLEEHPDDVAAAIRGCLRAQLPAYMLPSAVVVMDALPLTPNGKVDRRALPAPARRRGDAPPAEPRTETERALAAVWTQVLHAERVYLDDNFFELGGHSLLASQVVTRVREALGVELPLARIFDAPTLAQLSAVVEAAQLEAMAALMDDLDELSDEQVLALLEAEGALVGGGGL